MVRKLDEMKKKASGENKPILRELFCKFPDKNVIVFHTRTEAESWLEEAHGSV